jgi:DNA-binding NarL/FixJ family response regulator
VEIRRDGSHDRDAVRAGVGAPRAASALEVSAGVVEKHVASIFGKLGLPPAESDNRRVLAVLPYLGS